MASNEDTKNSGIIARTLKLFFIIFAVILVAPVLQQLDVSEDTVRIAGRIGVAIALVLVLFGIISKTFKVLGFILICLMVVAILASEEVIQLPNVMEALKQGKP